MLFTLSCLIISLVLYFWFKKPKNAHLRGPTNLPLIGALYLLDAKAPYLSLQKLSQKYGKVSRLKMGTIDTVLVTDAIFLKKLLLKDETLDRPPMYFMEYFFQYKGIIYARDQLWKDQRKFVTRYFKNVGGTRNSPNKQYLEGVINNNAKALTEAIMVRGEECSVVPFDILANTIAVLMKDILTGIDHLKDAKFWKTFVTILADESEFLSVGGNLNFIPILKYIPWLNHTFYKLKQVHVELRKFHETLLNEALKSQKTTPNVFKQFIQEENVEIYNKEQLRHLHHDLYIAGIDTCMNTFSWILLFLTEHQQVQDKIRNEISSVIGDSGFVKLEELEKLHFTQATISEVSRIRTVVPLGVPHYTTQDVVVDNVKIDKGSMILPFLWGIHMDPDVWMNPEDFKPERFLNEDGSYYRPDSFIPFQVGKRICVGEEIAKGLLAIFVVYVVRNFKLLKYAELNLVGECYITLNPVKQKIVFKKIN